MVIHLENVLSEVESKILHLASEVLEICDIKGYLVGGMVRDLILGRYSVDIDITVDGDSHAFVREFSQKLSYENFEPDSVFYEKFMTSTIKIDNISIDIASLRKETYERGGALPDVSRGTFEEDMKRRDFTMNSMAISLNKGTFGEVIDVVNGMKDLFDGMLAVHHDRSFIDDPTRILRGIRFIAREGYKFEANTLKLMAEAVTNKAFSTITKERIAVELRLALIENNSHLAFSYMFNKGILCELFPGATFGKKSQELFKKVDRYFTDGGTHVSTMYSMERVKAIAFGCYQKPDVLKDAIEIFYPGQKKIIDEALKIPKVREILKKLCKRKNASLISIYNAFSGYSEDTICVLFLQSKSEKSEIIKNGLIEARKRAQLEITGDDLKEKGILPGKIYGQIFEEVRRKKLKGKISTRDEELRYVDEMISGMISNPNMFSPPFFC